MRTPGDDFELAAGFLVTEGVVGPGTITRVAYCDDVPGEQLFNVVTVTTSAPAVLGEGRRAAVTSACGICGRASLDEVEVRCAPLAEGPRVAREVLLGLPGTLRSGQRVFEETGGLHAAGLFDADGAPGVPARGRRPPQRGRQGHRRTRPWRAGCPWPTGC